MPSLLPILVCCVALASAIFPCSATPLTLESGQQYRFELVARSNCDNSILGFNNRTCVVKDHPRAGAGPVFRAANASRLWHAWTLSDVRPAEAADGSILATILTHLPDGPEAEARCVGALGPRAPKRCIYYPRLAIKVAIRPFNDSELVTRASVWRFTPVPGQNDTFTISLESRASRCLRYLGGSYACSDASLYLHFAETDSPLVHWRVSAVHEAATDNLAGAAPAPAVELPAQQEMTTLGVDAKGAVYYYNFRETGKKEVYRMWPNGTHTPSDRPCYVVANGTTGSNSTGSGFTQIAVDPVTGNLIIAESYVDAQNRGGVTLVTDPCGPAPQALRLWTPPPGDALFAPFGLVTSLDGRDIFLGEAFTYTNDSVNVAGYGGRILKLTPEPTPLGPNSAVYTASVLLTEHPDRLAVCQGLAVASNGNLYALMYNYVRTGEFLDPLSRTTSVIALNPAAATLPFFTPRPAVAYAPGLGAAGEKVTWTALAFHPTDNNVYFAGEAAGVSNTRAFKLWRQPAAAVGAATQEDLGAVEYSSSMAFGVGTNPSLFVGLRRRPAVLRVTVPLVPTP